MRTTEPFPTVRKLECCNPTQSFSFVKKNLPAQNMPGAQCLIRRYTEIEAQFRFCHNSYSIFNPIHNCFSLAGCQWEFSILTFNNYNYTYVCIFSGAAPLILLASPFSIPLRVLKLLKLHVHIFCSKNTKAGW